MTITVNIGQIVINIGQPSPESLYTENLSPENSTIVEQAESKPTVDASTESKSEIELAMATYRFRLSEKIRQLFGDETANHFLAGGL
ncbi:hypothetical protein [Pseudomonas guariconensis]|uniref:hypothetical protein n=1 Tax=Pseudomonas guariconensis TaxID=1288410 RepID=UPI0018AC629A|nr:hypothetical protein [Pseudomonas guariconensis]MBF8740230.1 hypothetical protein [Pseudomonas guariconensis]MBF8750373.1 hypothetical protein [Pseudomonas guariconensis]